ncbi:MAG: hypothetical protein O7G85_13395, partial [Planctomycetota bacterium]|nr:hypothetical protein [Planctomycetota bacterium]
KLMTHPSWYEGEANVVLAILGDVIAKSEVAANYSEEQICALERMSCLGQIAGNVSADICGIMSALVLFEYGRVVEMWADYDDGIVKTFMKYVTRIDDLETLQEILHYFMSRRLPEMENAYLHDTEEILIVSCLCYVTPILECRCKILDEDEEPFESRESMLSSILNELLSGNSRLVHCMKGLKGKYNE